MNLSLTDPYDPVDTEAIERFETDIGHELPEQYQDFLLRHNGGVFRPLMVFDEPGCELVDIFVAYALDLEKAEHGSDLRWVRGIFSDRIHEDLLVFGRSGTGEQFCICLAGEEVGQIYYWKHDVIGSESLRFLTKDMNEFLARLERLPPEPREQLPAFQTIERGEVPDLANVLAAEGSVDLRNASEETLLMCALSRHNYSAVNSLLARGADIEARDNGGRRPIHMAAMSHWRDGMRLLIDKGADVNARDDDGMTPLMMALLRGNRRIAKLLIGNNADIEIAAKDGVTPLMVAVQRRDYYTAEGLLDRGANPSAKANDGRSVIEFIGHPGRDYRIVELLEKHGARE